MKYMDDTVHLNCFTKTNWFINRLKTLDLLKVNSSGATLIL